MSGHRTRIAVVVAALAASALALSGCGDSGSNAAQQSGDSLTHLTVAVSPNAPTSAPMYLGVEKGFFKQRGLDIKLTVLQNGSVAIPQVLNGQTQFSMASFEPAAQAVQQGLAIKLIGGANVIPTDPDTKYQGIIVRDGIKDLSQLKTFAAQSTEPDPTQEMAVDKLGGDYKSLKLIAVPFAQVGDAVRQGNADAAMILEPFLSNALKAGGVKLFSYVGPGQSLPGTPGAVFIGADKYMAAHPSITSAFIDAVEESYSYAQAHLQEVANYVPKTGLSDQVPAIVALGQFQDGPLQDDKVDQLLDLYQRAGLLDGSVTAAKLVYHR